MRPTPGGYPRGMGKTEVLDRAGLEALVPEWRDLAAADPAATPFQTPEWVLLWHARLAPRRALAAVAVREGNDLVGLLPLARSAGPWRVWRTAGTGPSDYLAPLLRPGATGVAGEIAARLTDSREVDLVDLHQIPARSALASSVSGEGIVQSTCLRVELPERFDDYVKSLSKSLRADVRRIDKLDRSVYAFEETADPAEFLRLHAERWRKRGLPGAFIGRLPAFHREWCALAHERGWLRMTVLRENGEAIGALYGMAFGGRTFFYQSGFAPTKSSVSPGTLLIASTIRRSIDEGRLVFDLMRGDEGYKRRWRPTVEETNLRFLLPGRGPLGRAGEWWNRRAERVEARVRARLEGRGLLA